MKVIVSHEHPDFDALASLALANLLVPDGTVVVQGGLPTSLEGFVNLYRDVVDLHDLAEIDLADVTELIVVDTAEPGRIRPFDQLVGRVPVTLFDHHPSRPGDIPAGKGLSERVGAAATLLTRALEANGRHIPAEIATLALLGIHEDTGNFTYRATRPDDHHAAAYLLGCGANLEVVRRFSRDVHTEAHAAFRDALFAAAEDTWIGGHRLAVASFEYPDYVPGVSSSTNELLDAHNAEAAIVAVRMEDRTLVFARAVGTIDVGAALETSLDGGGHPGAAFARTDVAPHEALQRVLTAVAASADQAPTAKALMSRPVKTVGADSTVTEAQRMLASFGHNGLPVMDAGELVGIVSRRDLERALRHGLGRSEVRGFMTKNVISANEDTPLAELERLVEQHNIGRIPIMRDDHLVGIVTRTDLLAARHRPSADRGPLHRVLDRLPRGVRDLLETAGDEIGDGSLYLVGGTVRDALLGTGMTDLDISVVGVPIESFGQRLQQRLGGSLSCHLDFGTCTLSLPSGVALDIATAREEVYDHPGALPEVTPSTFRKDLARRDFTVNAVAVRLRPSPPELVDPYGGVTDIEARILRIMHPLSFFEDPTRIVRGARLAGRLAFELEADTAERARSALVPEVIDGVSHARLRAELELTLAETRVAPCLGHLEDLGALRTMYGLPYPKDMIEALDDLRAQDEGVPDESYLLALLYPLDERACAERLDDFHWPKRVLSTWQHIHELAGGGVPRDESLEALGPAGRAVLRTLDDHLAARVRSFEEAPARRKLRGQDVLELGLPEGPQIGEILAEVADARAEGRVTTFDEERDLARRLVAERRPIGGSDT